MGLGEGAGQEPGPPAPCRRRRVRSARAAATPTSEPLGGREGEDLLRPREPPRGCPWVLNTLLPRAEGRPARGLALSPKVPTPALRPVRTSLGTVRGLSSLKPRRCGSPRPRPSRERAEGWGAVSEDSPDP